MEDSLFTNANISKSNVRFKFEYVTKGASNNFYLDNIRIGEMGSLSMKSDENKAISYRQTQKFCLAMKWKEILLSY